jgi:biopolymer transport protein ExbB
MTDFVNGALSNFGALLAQTDPSAGAPAARHVSLLEYINSGGTLSYILIMLSMIALGLIISNLIVLRAEYLMPPRIVGALERLLRERNVEGIFAFAREKDNDRFLTRVVAGALSKVVRSQFGLLELKPALEEAASKELDRLDRPTHGLALLAAIGPMLGLLGTVFGMIGAFGAISAEQGAARSAKLAEFMSLALVNTAEGLVLAIPCTIAYSLFRRRTDRLMSHVADVAERLAAVLQGAMSGAAARPAGAPPPVPMPRPAPTAVPTAANQPGVSGGAGGAAPVQAPAFVPTPGVPLPPAAPRSVATQPTGPA